MPLIAATKTTAKAAGPAGVWKPRVNSDAPDSRAAAAGLAATSGSRMSP